MLLELCTVETIDRRGRKHKRIVGKCTCTTCGKEFMRGNYDWRNCQSDPTTPTFCSQQCSRPARRKGGISDKRLRQRNIETYGVEYALQLIEIQNKRKQTCLDKYGVNNVMQSKEINERAKSTIQKKYGTNSAFHIPANRAKLNYETIMVKQLETMRRNKTFQSSRAEERLFALLQERFNVIERQVRIPGTHWHIDFHILEIDTWIQVDGVYWHGLDRPLDEIESSVKHRDQKIIRSWYNDRAQDAWFAEHGMHLIRITDKQVNQMNDVQSLLDVLQGPPASSQ